MRRVSSLVERAGLTVGRVSLGARTLHVTGTAGAIGRLFGVTLERWAHASGEYRRCVGSPTAPPELRDVLLAVLGLDNRPQARAHFRRRTKPSTTDVAYSPLTVAAAYEFPPSTDGSGETIALLELGGGFALSDLATYFAGLGVPAPSVIAVSVDGAENAPTGSPDGPDGEVELDVEVAGSLAPGSKIAVYFAPNTDQGFLDGVSQAIHDTTHRPSILSISWGGPESSWSVDARTALNAAIQDGAALGVTVLAAAGDQGAHDGVASGALTVDFPASSPFVTACGGTRLLLRAGAIASEVVWNELAQGEGATGGGVSQAFPLPAFQADANVPRAPNGFVGRGVPDVAGDADPTTGYSVYVDGAPTVIGGTSAVAPLWAALTARLNQALGAPVGFLDPFLYSPAGEGALHDVTTGNNDGYSAGPGWDPCTGWGTPDGVRLLQALRNLPSPP